jgi:hypothetical protein
MKRLEVTANVSVLIVALLCGYVLIVNNVFGIRHRDSVAQQLSLSEPLKGTTIKLSGVALDKSHPALVFAISSRCHFCIESAEFYREVTTLRQQHSIKSQIVMAFPQNAGESKEFLDRYKIQPDKIVTEPLEELGVTGTPTLLLVGTNGKVEREWIGRLSPEQREDVLREIKN